MTGQDGRPRTGRAPREAELLTEQLQLLRRRSGVTLAALANRTSYSKSSWGRYLSGKALPPRQALREFAQAVSAKPDRLLLLLEIAEHAEQAVQTEHAEQAERQGQDGEALEAFPPAAPDAAGEPVALPSTEDPVAPGTAPLGTRPSEPRTTAPASPRRRRRLALGAALGVGMVAGLISGMLITAPASLGDPAAGGGSAKCSGFECRNKDAQRMECHVGVWTAAAEEADGVYLELRYSPRCGAAWARITEGQVGDTARVEGPHNHSAERAVTYDRDTYSPMVEAPYPAAARACVVLKNGGTEVCTPHGGASPLPAAVTDESKP